MNQKSLDLYAKIESMIGFDEAYDELYERYMKILDRFDGKRLLDVGCGNGNFLLKVKDRYEAIGIDLSSKMVEIAKQKGVDARCMTLSDLDEKFDLIVAIGDVLNYLKPDELESFLSDVERLLENGGIFVCDLNTLHGFEDVTAGSLAVDRDDEFLAIDAEFFEGVLQSDITYFKQEGNCYKKEKEKIFQYYYDKSDLCDLTTLKLDRVLEISMFSDKADKNLYIFSKIS